MIIQIEHNEISVGLERTEDRKFEKAGMCLSFFKVKKLMILVSWLGN